MIVERGALATQPGEPHLDECVRLSLVIPAYNEAKRLAAGLPKLIGVIPTRDTEIIIVDDGSSDGTLEVARCQLHEVPKRILIRLPRNSGKGAAVRAGVVKARGDIIAYMDADMATDPRDLVGLVEALGSSPVAVGSRAAEGSVVEGKSRRRSLITRSFSLLVSSTLDLPTHDTQCGFKAFHGPVAKLLFHGARVDSFAFEVEVLARAIRLGLTMEEVPVRWTDVAGSKVRLVRDSLRMLADVGRTRRGAAGVDMPIHGIASWGPDSSEVARSLYSSVRRVDPVLSWDGGAVALFPCVAPTVAAQMVRRIRSALPSPRFQHVELSFETLGRSGLQPGRTTA